MSTMPNLCFAFSSISLPRFVSFFPCLSDLVLLHLSCEEPSRMCSPSLIYLKPSPVLLSTCCGPWVLLPLLAQHLPPHARYISVCQSLKCWHSHQIIRQLKQQVAQRNLVTSQEAGGLSISGSDRSSGCNLQKVHSLSAGGGGGAIAYFKKDIRRFQPVSFWLSLLLPLLPSASALRAALSSRAAAAAAAARPPSSLR